MCKAELYAKDLQEATGDKRRDCNGGGLENNSKREHDCGDHKAITATEKLSSRTSGKSTKEGTRRKDRHNFGGLVGLIG